MVVELLGDGVTIEAIDAGIFSLCVTQTEDHGPGRKSPEAAKKKSRVVRRWD